MYVVYVCLFMDAGCSAVCAERVEVYCEEGRVQSDMCRCSFNCEVWNAQM